MTAFRIQTFVPSDGIVSITLPERFRKTKVELFVSEKEMYEPHKMSREERLALLYPFGEAFLSDDSSSMSDEEYIKGIRSLRGILTGPVDYSDLREETDREL